MSCRESPIRHCPNQNCTGTIEDERSETGMPSSHCTSCDFGEVYVLIDDVALLDFELDDGQKEAVRRLEELREARRLKDK